LRDEPNTYGFVTKKAPNNDDDSFFMPGEYKRIFDHEMGNLEMVIENSPDKTFLISKFGSGLANRYHIFEEVIEPSIKSRLSKYPNVKFLW